MRLFGKQTTLLRWQKLTICISGEDAMSVRTIHNMTLPKQTVDPGELYAINLHQREVPLVAYKDAVPKLPIELDNHRLSKPLECGNHEDALSAVRTQLD